MNFLNLFKKKKEVVAKKSKFKYNLNIRILRTKGFIEFDIGTHDLNPYNISFYKRLCRWYYLRKTPLYTLHSFVNNLPYSTTIKRKDIISIITKYNEN